MPSRFLCTPVSVLLRILVVLAACISLAHAAGTSTKRVALVIGNDAYKHVPPLEKAANDARAMGRALQQAGFETRTVINATRAQMNSAINQLADDVAGGGIGIFFFAGHGVQVNNQNYLIPVDLQNIQREADIADQGVSLQGMQDKLAEVRAKFSLLVIDACRDNPLPRKAGRALGSTRGLSQASSAEGQMVVFSAGANQQALDKLSDTDSNPNGVFTRELLPWIAKPGVSIREAVLGVRSAVRARAKTVSHEQFPAIYDQAEGNFYFVEGAEQGSPTSETRVAALGGVGIGTGRTAAQIEDELWDAIKDGDKASVFEEYLKQYPKGRYLAQAKVKIARLKAEAKQPAPIALPPGPTPAATASIDAETALWNEVQKGNTADDYDAYLKQYPKGKYAVLAKQRRVKLAEAAVAEAQRRESEIWSAAERSNTEDGYAAYLRGYPSGLYATLAQARIKKLQADPTAKEEQELWKRAETASDKAPVENYLRRYPTGRYVALANTLLAAMKEREPAKVKVTIYRETQFVGGAMVSKVNVDDRWVGSLSNGQSLTTDIPAGVHTLSVFNTSSWGGHECQITVTLEAGTVYRYFLDFISGGNARCTLTQKNSQVAAPS